VRIRYHRIVRLRNHRCALSQRPAKSERNNIRPRAREIQRKHDLLRALKEILTNENPSRPIRIDQIRFSSFIIVIQIRNDRNTDFAKCSKREATVGLKTERVSYVIGKDFGF